MLGFLPVVAFPNTLVFFFFISLTILTPDVVETTYKDQLISQVRGIWLTVPKFCVDFSKTTVVGNDKVGSLCVFVIGYSNTVFASIHELY